MEDPEVMEKESMVVEEQVSATVAVDLAVASEELVVQAVELVALEDWVVAMEDLED